MIIDFDAPILVTGGAGFIGKHVVENLVHRGFQNVRCFSRKKLDASAFSDGVSKKIEWIQGNLHSKEDCVKAARDVQVVFHLAAGTGTKSYADAFLNSVVTTRNLLEAIGSVGDFKRFASISSFAVYSNKNNPVKGTLDESGSIATGTDKWRDAYTYAKIKQDELIEYYGREKGIPYVLLRPGAVYGPGKHAITGRVGIGSLGIFLHLGGGNRIPFTYVENCAEAIVLAGLKKGVDGEVFNVVDDNTPTSRWFLTQYKKKVRKFQSIYLPHFLSYLFCLTWEKYSKFSNGQLPLAYHRAIWHAQWKKTRYCNEKLKKLLDWQPIVSTEEGMDSFFDFCQKGPDHA